MQSTLLDAPAGTLRRSRGDAATRPASRAVSAWLLTVAFMVLVMVALGGATRVTGSGLSIMEWAPLAGTLPPLTHAEWERLFALYRTIPQFRLQDAGFGLADFQRIFWLEWTHRLWGRLLGVAFLLPLVWFVWRGMIGRVLLPRLVLLFVLGGLQGAVGWFMVASGFLPDSVSVSAYRLVVHLSLALVLYAALLWTGMTVWPARPRPGGPAFLRRMGAMCAVAVALTIVAGGFVAGLHAGLTYNTFPWMDGRLVPADYAALSPALRNPFENVAAVQFDHRLLATLSAVTVAATVAAGWIVTRDRLVRIALTLLALVATLQYGLGVATLLSYVPPGLAVAHQVMATLLLTASLFLLYALRPVPVRLSPSLQDAP